MALRRVLVLNKWCRFAPPDKHTSFLFKKIKLNSLQTKRGRIVGHRA